MDISTLTGEEYKVAKCQYGKIGRRIYEDRLKIG